MRHSVVSQRLNSTARVHIRLLTARAVETRTAPTESAIDFWRSHRLLRTVVFVEDPQHGSSLESSGQRASSVTGGIFQRRVRFVF